MISGIWLWGTCKGRLGEPDGELSLSRPGEPGGTAFWSLHINLNSKNPSKQSLVRELDIFVGHHFAKATFAKAKFDTAILAQAKCAEANFAKAKLAKAKFAKAACSKAKFPN